MRRLFTFLVLTTFAVFISTAQEWNISSDDFNSLGVLEETTEVNGLTIYAHDEKKVEIDANNKSLDGIDYTHRLKLGGSGDFDEDGQPLGRVLAFQVSGNAKITVIGMSSSSGEDRQLRLAADSEENIFATFPALGPEISKGEYEYTGGPATILLYSPSSGVNVYHLLVEEEIIEITGNEWNISSEEFNALGTLTETTVVNGLTIWAHSGKTITIDENNKSLDGMDFTHRLKLGGQGDFDENGLPLGRVISFEVEGSTEITVMGMSSSSDEDRELQLASAHGDSIFATFPALGPEISKGVYVYQGGPSTIFLYSSHSGVNIYYLKAVPVTSSVKPNFAITPEIRVYPNPATDRVFVNVNKPTQVAIYNLAGSMVKSQMIESQNDFINVSDLQPGMYIIKSQFSNEFAHKLIVR
ncbi:MAG TPA: T9SS type A sorting domain-containing protein [Mariniphaga anaerophila]|uniref:T9SS type A sorting domain-containing protein n=1 Tax=Mariniphaga anaerophila TaxID=1484053 RepID=A0A831LSG6_9BACT|nr:T9SS type A sorting domain-containing protein [Mariniphaga anaerophila]